MCVLRRPQSSTRGAGCYTARVTAPVQQLPILPRVDAVVAAAPTVLATDMPIGQRAILVHVENTGTVPLDVEVAWSPDAVEPYAVDRACAAGLRAIAPGAVVGQPTGCDHAPNLRLRATADGGAGSVRIGLYPGGT